MDVVMEKEQNNISFTCEIDGKDSFNVEFTESELFQFKPFIKGECTGVVFLNQEDAKKLRDFLNHKLG